VTNTTNKPRARDIGIPLEGETGPHNNITDVPGLEVGYSTLIMGQPEDYVSDESLFARTGVTAILPRGRSRTTVVAGRHSFNGYGELTGVHYLDDFGQIDGPVMLTNTFSVGTVRDAAYKWFMQHDLIDELFLFGEPVKGASLMYPVVGETYDGFINNARGFHVKEEHAFEAIQSAASGPIAEGNVGGGTGMQTHLFKGGSGSSSRVLSEEGGGYTLGVFVQANHGYRERFTIKGIPVGKLVTGCDPNLNGIVPGGGLSPKPGTGSIIVVVATDAPVTSRQLDLLCKRVPIGIGLLGGGTGISSGDIFVGFSTAHTTESLRDPGNMQQREGFPHDSLDPLFRAVVDATEEAILNAMVAAETMVGINGNTLFALPHDQVKEILKDHGRLMG
jgi:L-aminopeptidase/D-esterase-like protein